MKPLAVQLQSVSKIYKIPAEKHQTLKSRTINFLQSNPSRQLRVLSNLDLQIPAGQFLGIIGRNGAGKSTLLKLINQTSQPSSGSIIVNGTITPLLELGLGFEQELPAKDNILLNAALLNIHPGRLSIDQILQFAGLDRCRNLKLKNYSTGMRQRLAFSIAAHSESDIYLCDEIFAVGDQSFQNQCRLIFRKWRQSGKTILLTSHNADLIEQHCDRAILLDNSQILADGKPASVISQYHRLISPQTPGNSPDFSNSPLRLTQIHFPSEIPSGQPLTIALHYHATTTIKNPVFGLAIHHQDGTHITGPNTKTSNCPIPAIPAGPGKITAILQNQNLQPGTYLLTASIFDHACQHPYDYLDKQFAFTVKPVNDNHYGVVDLSPKWHFTSETQLQQDHHLNKSIRQLHQDPQIFKTNDQLQKETKTTR